MKGDRRNRRRPRHQSVIQFANLESRLVLNAGPFATSAAVTNAELPIATFEPAPVEIATEIQPQTEPIQVQTVRAQPNVPVVEVAEQVERVERTSVEQVPEIQTVVQRANTTTEARIATVEPANVTNQQLVETDAAIADIGAVLGLDAETDDPLVAEGGTLLGDVNLDGVVDLLDIADFRDLHDNPDLEEVPAEADINGDGVVNDDDVPLLVNLIQFGTVDPPS